MKRTISLFLTVVLCVVLCLPFTVNGADEYISSNKSTFAYGEYMEIVYKFSNPDATRWVCVYKDTAVVSNMVFTYPATSTIISGYYLPWLGVSLNGHQLSDTFAPGNYIMKVMHIPEGGNYMDANNFSTGSDSDLTYSFTVTANSNTTPTLSVSDREIEQNGTLKVSYSGISYLGGNHTLNLVVTDQNGKVIRNRAMLGMNDYVGNSGIMDIALVGVAPGTYKVALTSSNPEYTYSQPIEITVTEQGESGNTSVFPVDLLKNKEICGRYFTNADNTYSVVDGEYVMSVPYHMGVDYMYTWEAIPYDTFTVSFDFLLHIAEDMDSQISDEMDFLFGVSEDGKSYHQLMVGNASGALNVSHWYRESSNAPYVNYSEDNCFYDIYEEEMWYTLSLQITADDVTVFIDGEEVVLFSNSEGCIGANGRIGLRGGSKGGWDIKNLKVQEGLYNPDGEVATEAPATTTPVPTKTPVVTTVYPTVNLEPTATPTGDTAGNSAWIVIVVVAVVVVACGVATCLLVLKKKK